MEMHERVKHLRKNYLHMSQTEFGNMLGVSRSVINNIERNALARPEQKLSLIKLMSNTFNINEEWILHGKEPMVIDDVSSTMQQLKKEYDLNSFDYELIAQYLQLTTDQRKTVCDYFRNVILASDNADSIASSVPDEPPADMDDIDSFTEHRKAAE